MKTRRLASLLLTAALLGNCQSNTKPEAQAPSPCPPLPEPYQVRHPAWLAQSSVYEVNIRQYTPEGTFRAFEKHLPRLDTMGVGILWLMPINPIGKSHRKGSLGSQYSVRDYRAVNPELGTLADLKHLVAEAHKRRMHVIIDWVANHTSWDNALLTEHPDWYTHDAQGRPHPPVADWQDVLDLDYSKPGLRTYMTASMVYWLKTANIDGFRCDVAGLVPTAFWNESRRELEKIKPVFMLADWDELSPPAFLKKEKFASRLLEQAFDATFTFRLHGLLDSLGRGQKPTTELARYYAAERRLYPPGISLMTFSSQHDINTWVGSEYERVGANAQPMAVLTALLPGIPLIYSGQEAASKKRLRFFDKDTIAWNGYPLAAFYTTLLHLKSRHPALRNYDACSQFRLLPSPAQTILFDRRKGMEGIVVAVNLGDKPQQVDLPETPDSLGWQYMEVAIPGSGKIIPKKPVMTTLIAPHSFRVWEQYAMD